MNKVINFNEFKSKKNRVDDIAQAKKYLFSIDIKSLEMKIADKVMESVCNYENATIRLNFTKIAREQDTTIYKVKKAYNNLIDNKVLVEVAKEHRRPVLVSSKNLMLACNLVEYIEAYL